MYTRKHVSHHSKSCFIHIIKIFVMKGKEIFFFFPRPSPPPPPPPPVGRSKQLCATFTQAEFGQRVQSIWIVCLECFSVRLHFSVGHMHCSQDLQVLLSPKITLKLDPTVLFTHLKIILLQYFQFSVISSIQIDL